MYNIRLACRVFIAGFILLLSSVAVESAMPCHHLDGHECDLVPVMRPVAAFYTFEMGSSELVDTYLTPLRYSGWTTGIGYDRWQAMEFDPDRWSMNLKANFQLDRTSNMVGNADMWYFGARFSWGMYRRWRMPYGIMAGIGGRMSADFGCLYASRNGNNPASEKAAVTVDAGGYIAHRFGNIFGKMVDLRYVTSVPLTGCFFSPDYGELYYEIYLGNHSGLAHWAWWCNYFRWDNLACADIHFGNTVVSVGYRCNVLSTEVNHITSRILSHSFVFGLGGEWISVSPGRKLSPEAKMVSALY